MSDQDQKPTKDKGNGLALILVIATMIIGFITSVLANAAYRAIELLEDTEGNLTATVTFFIFIILGISILVLGKLALATWRGEDISFWRLMIRRWKRDLILLFVILIVSASLAILFSLPIFLTNFVPAT